MIKRDFYIDQIKPLINKKITKVLVGFRRSGKSTILELVKEYLIACGCTKSQFISINFEDFKYYDLKDTQKLYDYLMAFIKNNKNKTYLFLDEIQEVKGFEEVINSLMVTEDVDIYITGSNSNLLSSELATYLAGRYVQIFVYPFSFNEYVLAKKQINNIKDNESLFIDYIKEGGMPFVVCEDIPNETKESYLKDIYNSVILKDIIERNSIRDIDLLDRTIRYVFSNVGEIFSATSISKYLKSQNRSGKVDTLLNYLKYCSDAMIFHSLKRYDLKGRKVFQTNEKYYLVDHGLREAMLHSNERDINLILENTVAIEGLRRGYDVKVGYINDYEIDFVMLKGDKPIYIQVTYLLASEKTIEREFRPLQLINDNYRKVVVSMDRILQPREGIEHKKIGDFLLEEEW